jgi:hypothetical protein
MRNTIRRLRRSDVMRQTFSGMALLVGLLVLGGGATVQAVSLGFVPPAPGAIIGNPVPVDLVITDLGTNTVGTFHVVVSFDPLLLSLDLADVIFGPLLGDPGSGEAVTDAVFVPGIPTRTFVNVVAVALLSPTELDALQPSSFTLATFTFDTRAVGTTPLGITINALGDANGDPLSLSGTPGTGAITVSPRQPGQIPEPSTWLLLTTGGVGLLTFHWRRRQHAV